MEGKDNSTQPLLYLKPALVYFDLINHVLLYNAHVCVVQLTRKYNQLQPLKNYNVDGILYRHISFKDPTVYLGCLDPSELILSPHPQSILLQPFQSEEILTLATFYSAI